MAYKFANIKERALYVAKIHEQSYQDFCASIGMSYASFKGSAKNRPLNSDAIENILTVYPKINAEWLLTGNGLAMPDLALEEPYENYKKWEPSEISEIYLPLYRLESGDSLAKIFTNQLSVRPVDSIKIPNLDNCDAAIYINSHAMSPLLNPGDVVAYKCITDFPEDIFWGEVYILSIALANEEYVSINYIQKSDLGSKYIKLVSQNEQFEPKDILLNKVNGMGMVKAFIKILS